MDMRIQGELVNGSSTGPSSRPTDIVRIGAGEGRSQMAKVSGDGDSVTLSDLAAKISDAGRDAEVHSSQRVAALAAVYSSGGEIASAVSVSRALIAHALGAEGDGA